MIFNKKKTINLAGKLCSLSKPLVMGILNVTPDSFYDGGAYASEVDMHDGINRMLDEGVDIIDVGAYSSRPGAVDITAEEEIIRLSKALDILATFNLDIAVSVDTFRSEVADFVLSNYKVDIINDISAGELDAKMFDVVAKYDVAYIMMHMRGTPQTMTSMTSYDNIVAEMLTSFSAKINTLRAKGVRDIIIDPGFGFAKDLDQNFTLLSQLHLLNSLEVPVLVGLSRKSMIYKLLDNTPQESLNGTTAAHMLALSKGADILRVHDVKEAKECIAIYNKMIKC